MRMLYYITFISNHAFFSLASCPPLMLDHPYLQIYGMLPKCWEIPFTVLISGFFSPNKGKKKRSFFLLNILSFLLKRMNCEMSVENIGSNMNNTTQIVFGHQP